MTDDIELVYTSNIQAWFRKLDGKKLPNSEEPKELMKIITHLTGEEWCNIDKNTIIENNLRFTKKLKNPNNFETFCLYEEGHLNSNNAYTCICSEDTCSSLYIIRHKPTDIYIAVGSICYKRFDVESKGAEIHYEFKADRCIEPCCNIPLVKKTRDPSCKYQKNTNKKCDGRCYNCIDKRIEELEEKEQKMEKKKKQLEKKEKELERKIQEYTIPENQELIQKKQMLKLEKETLKKEEQRLNEREQEISHRELLLLKTEEENSKENRRVYLKVFFKDKDKAKEMGARWDNETKLWYAPDNSFQSLIDIFG